MPTKPEAKAFTGNSPQIINAILNSNKGVFDGVPHATNSPESIKQIGAVIMNNPDLQNSFIRAIVNRIGLVIITSRLFYNPLSVLKKGTLDFGETIEEIFVKMAQPYQYDPDYWEGKEFKRFLPDVASAFHVVNYEVFYPVTIQNEGLHKAFLSWGGMEELLRAIVEQVYTGANWDEYQVMLYLIGRQLLNGNIKVVSLPTATKDTMDDIVTEINATSNIFSTTMSTEYNFAGVPNIVSKENQVILMTSKFSAAINVKVLAAAFNMEKAEFIGRQILVSAFDDLDIPRLNKLLSGHPDYEEFSAEELAQLKLVDCVLMDEKYFQVYDYLRKFTEQYSGINMYWNYYYHVQSVMSTSPFAPVVGFVEATNTIDSVAITPANANMQPNTSAIFNTTVTGTGFVSQRVTWKSDSEYVTVDPAGYVTVAANAPQGTNAVITATSVADPTKSATANITVGAGVGYRLTGAVFDPRTVYAVPGYETPLRLVLQGEGDIPTGNINYRFAASQAAVEGLEINKFTGVISAEPSTQVGAATYVEAYNVDDPDTVLADCDIYVAPIPT